MENRTLLKWLHAALAIGALIVFLAAPFISYGGKYEMNGADMLDHMGDNDVWLVLFIIIPLIAALSNLSDSKAFRGIASLAMLLPVLILLGETGNSRGMELAPGGMIYILGAIGMAILAFSTPDCSPSSQKETDGQRTDSDLSKTKSDALAEEIRGYEDGKLNEIVTNPALYKTSLIETCRRELEIRSRSAEFTAQVRTMDNARLREILASPQLYAEELIYACTLEQEERRRVRCEEQAKEEELRRLRREQEEKEAAERRAAAWKKWRPYVFAAVAVIVLAGIGAGYYSYHKEQVRLEQERIARAKRMEEQHIAEQKRVEAEQKQAEEKRKADAARKAEIAKLNSDANYRNSKGIYRIGDLHKNLKGIVFTIDNTGKHGKVLSLTETIQSWDNANRIYSNKIWRLPSINELKMIYKNKNKLNQAIVRTGGMSLNTKYGSYYWSNEEWGPTTSWKISMYDQGKNYANRDQTFYVRTVASF